MANGIVYDTSQNPVSFDSCNFFAIALGLVLRHNLDRLHLVVLDRGGRDQPVERDYPGDYRTSKLVDTVLVPASVCTAIRSVTLAKEPSDALELNLHYIIKNGTPGSVLPRLIDFKTIEEVMPPESVDRLNSLFIPPAELIGQLPDFTKKVLFFRRRSRFNKPRNTPDGLFERTAEALAQRGIDSLIVPDREEARIPQVPHSILERLAAGSTAKFCVTWGGGLSAPLWFSSAKLLITGLMDEAVPINSAEMAQRKGPFQFQQPAWFGNRKKFHWIPNEQITPDLLDQAICDQLESMNAEPDRKS